MHYVSECHSNYRMRQLCVSERQNPAVWSSGFQQQGSWTEEGRGITGVKEKGGGRGGGEEKYEKGKDREEDQRGTDKMSTQIILHT